ncbi:unnamed protein product, partial [Amoebophrya sp. A120]
RKPRKTSTRGAAPAPACRGKLCCSLVVSSQVLRVLSGYQNSHQNSCWLQNQVQPTRTGTGRR